MDRTTSIEMVDALSRRGNTVYFLAPYPNVGVRSGHAYGLPSMSAKYLSSPSFCLTLLFYLPGFVIRKKIEIIVVTPPSSPGTLLTSMFRPSRILLDVRGAPNRDIVKGVRGSLINIQYKFSLLLAKTLYCGITAITTGLKREICEEVGIDPSFVGTWTSGVSTASFNPERHLCDREELRKRFGLSDKFVLMHHGTLSPNKGLSETVEAIGILRNKCREIALFILGSGSAQAELDDLVDRMGLQAQVLFHGSVDYGEVPRYLSLCDVGVVGLPTHAWWKVSAPLKLLEYLSMGKPVVATDTPFHREVLEEAKCGVLVHSNSPAEIAKGIERLYRNRRLLDRMGENGKRLVRAKYTWDAKAGDLESFIRRRLVEIRRG